MEWWLVAGWLAVCLAFGLAGAPVAALAFDRLPGRGAAFALPCALGGATLVAYWVGKLAFGPVAVAAGVLAVVAAALLARRAGATPDRAALAEASVVFVAGFALLLAVKAVDPAIAARGGEKFLDFALLNAVHDAGSLPPEDPWFAGEPVRYYYGGYLASAVLAHLSGTPPAVAFNLAVATFFGMLASAAYGLAGAVAARHDRSRRVGGALGVFFVALSGPLAVPVRVLFGYLPRDLALDYGHAVFGGIRMPYEEAYAAATTPLAYDAWLARYVVPGTPDVFPLWTFLNGDLRAHMVSAPFLVVLAACWYAYHLTPPAERRRRRLLAFGAVPLVGGVLALVSTWTLPTTWGLSALALATADGSPRSLLGLGSRAGDDPPRPAPGTDEDAPGLGSELRRTATAAAVAVVPALLSAALAGPMLLFHSPRSRGVGFLPGRSPLVPFLLVHGCFLALFGASLLRRSDASRRRFAVGATGVLVALAAAFQVAAAAATLVGLCALGGYVAARRRENAGFETVLLVAGAGLVLATELLYARVWPPDNPRWNTVYKVYHQTWVLWGVAAGVVATRLLGAARDVLAPADHASDIEDARRTRDATAASDGGRLQADRRGWLRVAVGVLAVVVVLNAATFGALALAQHFEFAAEHPDRVDPSLDGTRYVDDAHPDAAAAIDWLAERPDSQVLVSHPGRPYVWRNAPSTMTDHVAVLGWKHEAGYRGMAAYERRQRSVELVYEGDPAVSNALLDHHGVSYVYVGPVERDHYLLGNLSARPALSVAFEHGNVTVYAVDEDVVANATVGGDGGATAADGREGDANATADRARNGIDSTAVRPHPARTE